MDQVGVGLGLGERGQERLRELVRGEGDVRLVEEVSVQRVERSERLAGGKLMRGSVHEDVRGRWWAVSNGEREKWCKEITRSGEALVRSSHS